MIEINLTGQWKTIRAAVPHIIRGAAATAACSFAACSRRAGQAGA